ncbi:hypothetical protein [Stygiolobus caldivivus]|uniref:Uncharacterized protein n=1 Tax=Stygiolobus caldivivus TaxID=2824673 RepID=A0A8D5U4E7_9CREN|nr:hypothetical protein [Stygiolobus caldivivus]BCU68903.1 hypothetical protein KN1_02000 [Stygiolobus caldivivus]
MLEKTRKKLYYVSLLFLLPIFLLVASSSIVSASIGNVSGCVIDTVDLKCPTYFLFWKTGCVTVGIVSENGTYLTYNNGNSVTASTSTFDRSYNNCYNVQETGSMNNFQSSPPCFQSTATFSFGPEGPCARNAPAGTETFQIIIKLIPCYNGGYLLYVKGLASGSYNYVKTCQSSSSPIPPIIIEGDVDG